MLNDIIGWVESKPKFWHETLNLLIRNNQISDADIVNLVERCKSEVGLSTVAHVDVDIKDMLTVSSTKIGIDDISLVKIRNVDNINALSSDIDLGFSLKGLTVVYGDNGSGKSSLVGILKNVCNTRGENPLLIGNLYSSATFGEDKKAVVEYSTAAGQINSVNLMNGNVDDIRLKAVDVFDSRSATHYIEQEDEIAFIPRGLAIVDKFASGIKKIEQSLSNELKSPRMAKFDYKVRVLVPSGTRASLFLQALDENTPLDNLRTASEWTARKQDSLDKLSAQILKLRSSDPSKDIKLKTEKLERFVPLVRKYHSIEVLGDVSLNTEVTKAVENFTTTRKTLEISTHELLGQQVELGVGTEVWRGLWESARKYYQSQQHAHQFPNIEDPCPLCQQELDSAARQRFTSFESYIKNDAQQQHEVATREVLKLIDRLTLIDFDFTAFQPVIREIAELLPNFEGLHNEYVDALTKKKESLLKALESFKVMSPFEPIADNINAKIGVANRSVLLNEEIEELKKISIADELQKLESERNELEGVKLLHENKPKLAREIVRLRIEKKLNESIRKCATNTITTLSNTLTDQYINDALKNSFSTELIRLGFVNLKIDTVTRGTKGKQYHYLRLNEPGAESVPLKNVLSEGEHRCISLATFFSELALSEHRSAIVFDDPVSSLDHKWRDRIGKRIVDESQERQVVVFTHDITFLLMLHEHCENINVQPTIRSLTRKQKQTGIIANNPPWDASPISEREGILNNFFQKLKKVEKDETEEVFREQAKRYYGLLRETWERLVEELLLNKVVQRFGREIQTQRVKKILDLTQKDYDLIEEQMSKCSKFFTGHDSAGGLIENMPNTNEIKADLEKLSSYIKELRVRRK